MSLARLEEAKSLAASGKLKEAADLLKGILQSDPDNAEVRSLLVDLQDRMMLELQISEMLKRASAQADKGDEAAAKKIVGEILKISPGHPGAEALVARLEGGERPAQPVEGEDRAPAAKVEAKEEESAETADFVFDQGESGLEGAPQAQEQEFSFDALESVDFGAAEQTVLSGASSNLSPAEAGKVSQYIKEGQAHFDAARYQDAIDAWTRVFIIDEENVEAQTLIDRAKEAMSGGQQEVEHQLTEAVAYFNAGDMDRSRQLLERILAVFPSHREALYYMGRIQEEATAKPEQAGDSAGPAAAGAPAGETESPSAFGDFELEDSLTVPTGPEMRAEEPAQEAETSAPSEFTFESEDEAGGFELETGRVSASEPAEPAQAGEREEPGKPAFELETGAVDEFTFSDLSKDVGAEEDKGKETGAGAPAMADFVWDQPLPKPSEPLPEATVPPETPTSDGVSAPPAGGGTPSAPAATPARKVPAPKKSFSPPSATVLILLVAGLLVVSLGIFFGARLLLGGGDSEPAAAAPQVPKRRHVRAAPKPPPPEEQPAPEKTLQTMSTDDILKEASGLMAQKNFEKAIGLYQEVLGRDAVNSEAQKGLADARAALIQQQQENERNEKFLKDLGYSINSFKDQDYAESLRIAWRLIYPDDSLARELGKKTTVHELIRDGYYNWSVQDLKRGNVRGAAKNLHDLLEFDATDKDAAKLQTFVKKYLNQSPDEEYNLVVNDLKYRSLSESP